MIRSCPTPETPLPVISRKPSSTTIRRAACGVTPSTLVAETSGFAMTSSINSGSFDDVRRLASFRSIICHASASRSCSFSPISAAAIDGDGFRAEIESGEMRRGGDAGLTAN